MRVVVRKSSSVVVKPSVPVMTTGKINLSPYDIPLLTTPVTMLLVFRHPIREPTETIKRGLSQALVHFHPISGRLWAGANNDEAHIRCTEEGVLFLGASANCAMKDIKSFDQSLQEDLAMHYPSEVCGLTDPLLMLQVTEFSCGGFVVGMTMSHAIADGAGMGQFLQAVGELARGLPLPSVVPVRWDASLMGIPTLSLLDIMHFFMNLQPSDVALQSITIPSSLINGIKDKFRGHSNGQPCTVFEVVSAVLWQCRTRAIMSDPEAPTWYFFSVNARKFVGAKNGYYGNCVVGQVVMATCGIVADGNIMHIIKMIQCAKDQIPHLFNKERDSRLKQLGSEHSYNGFTMTSLQNLGIDQADFGGGRPSRVMIYKRDRVHIPACALDPPCKGNDGTHITSLLVKEQHTEAFLGELASFTQMANF